MDVIFKTAGNIGFLEKADSQTCFDDLTINPL